MKFVPHNLEEQLRGKVTIIIILYDFIFLDHAYEFCFRSPPDDHEVQWVWSKRSHDVYRERGQKFDETIVRKTKEERKEFFKWGKSSHCCYSMGSNVNGCWSYCTQKPKFNPDAILMMLWTSASLENNARATTWTNAPKSKRSSLHLRKWKIRRWSTRRWRA